MAKPSWTFTIMVRASPSRNAPKSSKGSIAWTNRGPANKAEQASAFPYPSGPSRRTGGESNWIAMVNRAVRFGCAYPSSRTPCQKTRSKLFENRGRLTLDFGGSRQRAAGGRSVIEEPHPSGGSKWPYRSLERRCPRAPDLCLRSWKPHGGSARPTLRQASADDYGPRRTAGRLFRLFHESAVRRLRTRWRGQGVRRGHISASGNRTLSG